MEIFDEHVPGMDPDHEFVAMIGFGGQVTADELKQASWAARSAVTFSVNGRWVFDLHNSGGAYQCSGRFLIWA